MRKIQIALFGLILLGLPSNIYAQAEHIFLIKAFNCSAGPKNRTQTGFRIHGLKGIVTALHGVAGCTTVKAQSKQGPVLSAALSMTAVDVDNDLALLTSDELNAVSDDGLTLMSSNNLTPLQSVKVTGHPYGIGSLTTQLILRDPPIRTLRELLTEDAITALAARKSPSPSISVLSVQGAIVPGNSGAPVFNISGEVVGVADGGLFGGATDITWAIPVQNVQWKTISQTLTDRVRQLGSMNADALFSFDENVPPRFPITLEEQKEFSKGLMATKVIVTSDGQLEATTTTRGTATFDGFCGNVTFWFFDKAGKSLGVYGMGSDQQWCVGSGVESAVGGGARLRTDNQKITVPSEVINQTNSVAIVHLEGPGKKTADLLRQFLSRAAESKKSVEQ